MGLTTLGLSAAESWIFIGTYTRGLTEGPRGIHAVRFDSATGRLDTPILAAEAQDPSFLALSPHRRHVYAVSPTEAVAFAVAWRDGAPHLTLLNRQPVQGAGPCHLSVDPSGRLLTVANYGGGSVTALPIQANGHLGAVSSFLQHTGSSVHPRQQKPHAHSATYSPDGRFVFVADLGLDHVLSYRVAVPEGRLTPNDPPFAATAPGAGPRHFAFAPQGRQAYVINELNSTVTSFAYDVDRGVLTPGASVSTLPPGFTGDNTTAEIRVHPSGKFVYGSNRGHDSIAVFAVEARSGRLTPIQYEPTGGKRPRNFAVSPDGRWLIAANQDSDNLVSFRIDPDSGRLTPTGHTARVPRPVCVLFY